MTAAHAGSTWGEAVSPPRLLVVEDDRSIAELITLWFQANGWHVVVAHSGPEGVAQAVTFQPDAVVLDGMLSG
jgi:DNA-binding response OmpR family regulator